MNNVQFIGNCGRDTELKYAASGSAIAENSIAITKRWKDRTSGEEKERTDWIPVTAFGRTAERLADIGKKGTVLLVEGYLQVDQWEDKDTKKKQSRMKVVANTTYKIAPTKTPEDTPPQASKPAPKAPSVDPEDLQREGF